MEFKAAIFDVDGVIVDTAHIHHLSWREVFKKYDIPFSFHDFKTTIDGMPRSKGVLKILPHLNSKQVIIECDNKQKYFSRFLKEKKVTVFKSTVNLIIKLKKSGYKVAMASSSKNAKAILTKEKIYRYFDADAEGAFIKNGKPYPDIFLRAAKRMKVDPKCCVVFEDAQSGVTAAKRAGMKCIGISKDPKHRLKGADIIVNDLRSISIKKLNELFEGKK